MYDCILVHSTTPLYLSVDGYVKKYSTPVVLASGSASAQQLSSGETGARSAVDEFTESVEMDARYAISERASFCSRFCHRLSHCCKPLVRLSCGTQIRYQVTLYLVFFGLTYAVAQLNPKGFLVVLEVKYFLYPRYLSLFLNHFSSLSARRKCRL